MYRPSSYWSSTLLNAMMKGMCRNCKIFLFTICTFDSPGAARQPSAVRGSLRPSPGKMKGGKAPILLLRLKLAENPLRSNLVEVED